MVPFILPYGHDLFESTFWVISHLLIRKMFPTFSTREVGSGPFNKSNKRCL